MARVSARRGGLRAARFLPLVAGPGQRRRERQRYPAGCRHFQRGLRPRQWAGGSSWNGRPVEQPAFGAWRELRGAFLIRFVDAARAAHGPAWTIVEVDPSSAGYRAVGHWLGLDAARVSVPICIRAVGFHIGAVHHVGYYVDADHHASNYIGADHAVRFCVGVNHAVGSYAGADHVGLYIGAVHLYQPRGLRTPNTMIPEAGAVARRSRPSGCCT
jgi:hypothetical protein